MYRALSLLLISLAAVCTLIVAAFASQNATEAGAHAAASQQLELKTQNSKPKTHLPNVSCDFTTLNFNLLGIGTVGDTRAISITVGDTFEQFIAPPITATAASQGFAILNNSFSGSVTGGIIGAFTLANLNGLLITNPEGLGAAPRGFELNEIVLQGATGTITAAIAINFLALSSAYPYFPRAFNGYLHSTATSGSYAPYRYNGTLAGTIFSLGGNLTINAAALGRLYTGGGSLNEVVTALRTVPPNRPTDFLQADVISQFRAPDFTVGGGGALSHITPRSTFLGTAIGTIDGGFVLGNDALVVDTGPNAGKGWFAGEFTFSNADLEILTGPWLTDLNGNQMSGYVWQVLGTGVYTDSLLFGAVNGSFFAGGANFTGTMSGVYCDGSQIPTATPAATDTPVLTDTPTPEVTSAPTDTPTALNTDTPTVAVTSTFTVVATSTALVTSTITPTITPTGVATLTPCAIAFSDVQTTDYFYEAVRYLFCVGAISGYQDGTFRPYNATTRSQLCKIIVLAQGWPIDTSGGPHFSDVPPSNSFYNYIETAHNRDVIGGYSDGTFRGGNNLTRGQLCKIIVLAQMWAIDTRGGPHFTDVTILHPFYNYIETAYNRGVVSGYSDGTFRGGNSATRGQICKIVYSAR